MTDLTPSRRVGIVFHWTARIVGTLLVILWVGTLLKGFPALGTVSLNVRSLFFFQILTLIGFLLLWFHEVAGAYLALAAMVLFVVINLFTKLQFPMGGVIILFFLPSIMALISHYLLLKK